MDDFLSSECECCAKFRNFSISKKNVHSSNSVKCNAQTSDKASLSKSDKSSIKDDDEDIPYTHYEGVPISRKKLTAVMEWVKENSNAIPELLHFYMKSMLKNKTVIQFQIYGIGELIEERSAQQLNFALTLVDHFKQKFPGITVTCQEPLLVEAEKIYLRSKGIQIINTQKFSSKHFLKASEAATNISEPAFICYMIHGMHEMYEEFLEAHWKPELLSRCIIIGNNPKHWIISADDVTTSLKISEFGKVCDSKSVKFFDEYFEDVIFSGLCVYSISKENAEILVRECP